MKKRKTVTVDISSSAEALGLPFSEEDWKATPASVRRFIIEILSKRKEVYKNARSKHPER